MAKGNAAFVGMTPDDARNMALKYAPRFVTDDQGNMKVINADGSEVQMPRAMTVPGDPGLSAYELYAKQEQDAGRVPLSLDAWNAAHFGEDGFTPEPRWNGTALSFTQPDGDITSSVDLKGDPGYTPQKDKDYSDGQRGPMPEHRWDGTKLAFQKPDGSYSMAVDLKGDAASLPFSITGNIARMGRAKNLAVNIGSIGNGAARKTIPCAGIRPGDTVHWSFMDGSSMPTNLVPGGAWCSTAGQLTISYTVTGLVPSLSVGTINISAVWYGE